jgi:DNA polymerase-3 subunit alpha (Gram-positive type)
MNINPENDAMNIPYVVFDFETTGLKSDQDQIIEIGAVKVSKGIVTENFQQLINPLQDIPAQATAVNGIRNEDIENSPTISEILPSFLKFIDGHVLVAHNANFDSRFLSALLKRYKIKDLENYVIDTLGLSQKLFPEYSNHTLSSICKRLKLNNQKAHRALEDAEVTAKILIFFLKHLKDKNLASFRQVASFHGLPLGRIKGAPHGQDVKVYLENTSSSLF